MAFRSVLLLSLLMATACGDPGPTPEELAAKDLDRSCGRLYSSLTKVYQDELYKGGVAEVNFTEKPEWVTACAAKGLSEEQRKCMDPNIGGDDECKATLKPAEEKAKELRDLLLLPMTAKAPAEEPPTDGEAPPE